MKKICWLFMSACVALAGCGDTQETKAAQAKKAEEKRIADEDIAFIEKAKSLLLADFKDPYSAVLTKVTLHKKNQSGIPAVCGYVNGKNAYGVYVGERFFVVQPTRITFNVVIDDGEGIMSIQGRQWWLDRYCTP